MTITNREAEIREALLRKVLCKKHIQPNFSQKKQVLAVKEATLKITASTSKVEARNLKKGDTNQLSNLTKTKPFNATQKENFNTSHHNKKSEWEIKDQKLINWFNKLKPEQLPIPPFELSPGINVIGNNFYTHLENEIARGSISVRAKSGALQSTLQNLRDKITD